MPDPVLQLLNSSGGTITCRRGDPDPDKVTLVVDFGDGSATKRAVFTFEQLNRLKTDGVHTGGHGGSGVRSKHHDSFGGSDVVEMYFRGPGNDLAIVRARDLARGAFAFI